jgi:parallel beta-helix repeat protein
MKSSVRVGACRTAAVPFRCKEAEAKMASPELVLGLALFLFASVAAAATYTVTNTGDSGAGSLRQAILDANANPGVDTIGFNIPGAGVQTISPLTQLPVLTDTVTIDGYSQPGASANTLPLAQGSNAVILIELDGQAVTPFDNGLRLSAAGIVVRGLSIFHWSAGIVPSGPGCIIAGNFIGLDAAGIANPNPDHFSGTGISAEASTQIGGPNPADRNVISGNHAGILAVGAVVQGNLIGTDLTGTRAVPNTVGLADSGPATIGGSLAGEGNVIAGNHDEQMQIGAGTVVRGNFIGTDATGTIDLGGTFSGISVASGPTTIGGLGTGESNTIANNRSAGVEVVDGTGTTIRGNRIYDNGYGIGVGGDSRPNDPGDGDTGPNNYQNYPIVGSIDYGASTTTVHAVFNSKASTTYDIDFYSNLLCQSRPIAHDQGRDYIASIQVTTDGSGNASIDEALPIGLETGQVVTLVATDPGGNSSQFSRGLVLPATPYSGPASGQATALPGQLLEAGVAITIGGVPATNVTVFTPNSVGFTIPALPPGSVNDLVVTNPGSGGISSTVRNFWTVDFTDVPENASFYIDIQLLVSNEITAGVGGGNYGPTLSIKRQSMAVFLLKAKHGACYVPPPCTPGYFSDVACPSNFASWIQEMAVEGITTGCGGGNFCPNSPVRRDQMAVFLLRARRGATYMPPECAGIFTDVACPSAYANWIEELKAEGVTSGCGDGTTYCPSNNNTRAQMAAFIVNAFQLLE